MAEKMNPANNDSPAGQDNIMQGIEGMIGNLLSNTINKMQKNEISNQLGGLEQEGGEEEASLYPEMDMKDIKNLVNVMQKFIDNVNHMINQLEDGSPSAISGDEEFLDGYMTTADNVLEIAAFSMKDRLTGLSNRYSLDNRLILEWNRATRDKSPLGLLIFTVGGYDEKLHDEVFVKLAKTMENTIKRSTDFLARWSDNEFSTLLPITDIDGAKIVAERINAEIEKMAVEGEYSDLKSYIGVCVLTPMQGEQPADLINRTHKAFLKAKETEQSIVIHEDE